MTIEMIEVEEFNQGTRIKVIGVGGGGGNAVGHMIAAVLMALNLCAPTPMRKPLTRAPRTS